MTEKHKTKKYFKRKSGITLIALVVTIIVLLILAGISIQMLAGNNGILNRATQAKEATRGGEVQETVNFAATSNVQVKYIGGTIKTRADVINELHEQGKLTDEEVNLLTDEDNPLDVITIGGIRIDFSVLSNAKSLGAVYDSGDLKIGDKLTYNSNGQSDWIVFGKEVNEQGQETGNILITTELPIENGFNLKYNAEAWLKYESYTDTEYGLNYACSGYGGTIQGTQVYSRSIKIEDINYVVGLTPKTVTVEENTYNIQSFDTYTFGSDAYNETNKTANFWYPVLSGGTDANGTGTGFWKQPSAENQETFDNNLYAYGCDRGEYLYIGADTNNNAISASTLGLNIDNLKYICGNTETTNDIYYLVASRSMYFLTDYTSNNVAVFGVAVAGQGIVGTGLSNLCYSYSSRGYEESSQSMPFGIRPVVILPDTLLVEEQEDGTYDLAE